MGRLSVPRKPGAMSEGSSPVADSARGSGINGSCGLQTEISWQRVPESPGGDAQVAGRGPQRRSKMHWRSQSVRTRSSQSKSVSLHLRHGRPAVRPSETRPQTSPVPHSESALQTVGEYSVSRHELFCASLKSTQLLPAGGIAMNPTHAAQAGSLAGVQARDSMTALQGSKSALNSA